MKTQSIKSATWIATLLLAVFLVGQGCPPSTPDDNPNPTPSPNPTPEPEPEPDPGPPDPTDPYEDLPQATVEALYEDNLVQLTNETIWQVAATSNVNLLQVGETVRVGDTFLYASDDEEEVTAEQIGTISSNTTVTSVDMSMFQVTLLDGSGWRIEGGGTAAITLWQTGDPILVVTSGSAFQALLINRLARVGVQASRQF